MGAGRRISEDWVAVALGMGLILAALLLYSQGGAAAWLAVLPPKWDTPGQLAAHLAGAWPRYAALGAVWVALLGAGLRVLGFGLRSALAGVAVLYALSFGIMVLGQWSVGVRYNLEPPLVALALGLILANLVPLPAVLADGFRVEFFIKLGVVLLGATLPFSLLIWAGPVALAQAGVVSVVTFGVIFAASRALGLERRLAAVLAAGGAVCGVSAAIAIAAAVNARKQDVAVAISIVILWAIVMIFVLPFASAWLGLPAGVGGAWIGTSEFADAAGFAAAQAYGAMAAKLPGAPAGAADQAVAAFSLMKLVGRDIWIGLWAILLSLVATLRWEGNGVASRVEAGELWQRFPKFVLGFVAASALITVIAQLAGRGVYAKGVTGGLVTPIKNMRTWVFAFGFLSIGLNTRLRELAAIGWRPFAAFSAGVGVNLVLGLALSAGVFGAYWAGLGR